MADQALQEEVLAFTARQARVSIGRVAPTTSLFDDLGIDGLTAQEFMQGFAEKFEIDMTRYRHEHYFGPELAFNPFWAFWWCVIKGRRLDDGINRLEVGHLILVANAKRWFDP